MLNFFIYFIFIIIIEDFMYYLHMIIKEYCILIKVVLAIMINSIMFMLIENLIYFIFILFKLNQHLIIEFF